MTSRLFSWLKKWWWRIPAALAFLWFAAAAVLIAWPAPRFQRTPAPKPPPAPLSGCSVEYFPMSDGVRLHACRFPSPSATATATVVLLHGMAGRAQELAPVALWLSRHAHAEVLLLNLRGHADSSGSPGDVPRIGQFEQDLAHVLTQLRPRRRLLILGGHSAGGGIVLRYAASKLAPPPDAYLLFAPHLGHDSPTLAAPATPASPQEPRVRLHLSRTLGLTMLNVLGIRLFNGLNTLYFNDGPPQHSYSYRAMLSMAPETYRAALTADAQPMLVLIGDRDAAFRADRFAPTVALHPHSRTQLISGAGHDSLLHHEDTLQAAAQWLRALSPP